MARRRKRCIVVHHIPDERCSHAYDSPDSRGSPVKQGCQKSKRHSRESSAKFRSADVRAGEVASQPKRLKDSAQERPECFWCTELVGGGVEPQDGRCTACRTKYDSEPPDPTLDDTHEVFVHANLPMGATKSDSLRSRWRMQQLRGLKTAAGAPIATEIVRSKATAASRTTNAVVSLKIGPFALRRSGKQGQRVAEFTRAVRSANEVLGCLLECFACLGAHPDQKFEEIDAQCAKIRGFLQGELASLLLQQQQQQQQQRCNDSNHLNRGGPTIVDRAIAVVRDSVDNLKVMFEPDGSGSLSESHCRVYTTKSPLLTQKECRDVVAAAEAHASIHGWTTKRHRAYPTHDLPTTVLEGAVGGCIEQAVNNELLPELAELFGLERSRLGIQEMFVAKYSAAPGGLAELEEHEDGSAWSFVLALNDETEYLGGGTKFVKLDGKPVFRPPCGYATLFNGKNRHCGVAISAGRRPSGDNADLLAYERERSGVDAQAEDGVELHWMKPSP